VANFYEFGYQLFTEVPGRIEFSFMVLMVKRIYFLYSRRKEHFKYSKLYHLRWLENRDRESRINFIDFQPSKMKLAPF